MDDDDNCDRSCPRSIELTDEAGVADGQQVEIIVRAARPRTFEPGERASAAVLRRWQMSVDNQPVTAWPFMNETSLSLLARIQQSGDSDSWNRLVEVYAPLLHKWLRSYEVNGADADDLVQEILTVVVQELPKFNHNERVGAFRNWLRRILVHRLRNEWRRRKKRPLARGGSSLLEHLNQLEDDHSELSRLWNEEHDREVVARLLQLVRPRFQPQTWMVFLQQMFEGQSPDRIAAKFDMSIGSVYMARHRVLHALRQEAEGLVDWR